MLFPTNIRRYPNLRSSELAMIADDLGGPYDTIKDLVVWNTESRSLSEEAAYQKVRRACAHAIRPETRILLKKTDSAFRGHYGREIAAVMDAWPEAITGLLPAIPAFGRVTRDGVQYIDGVPIAESFYSQDPKHPVTESRVAVMASKGNPRLTALLTLEMVRSSSSQKTLDRLLASGTPIIVVDSETQNDLDKMVTLFLHQPTPVILVGGQGIGQAVAKHCQPRKYAEAWTKVPQGAIVIVCGSLHPRTRQQLQNVAKAYDVEPISIPSVLDESIIPCAVDTIWPNQVLDQIARSNVGILATPEHVFSDPILVETLLADILLALHHQIQIAGVILTGGATAYAVCHRLGIRQLQLRKRMGFGVVVAQAPEMAGAVMGIKGGSLGEPDAFINLVNLTKSLQG